MADESSPPTRGYHHGQLREALLEAALDVLRERGPAGLSLREVARRAGVSHGAPAHHFGDKAGLLTALAVQGFERFHRALATAVAGQDDAVAAFAETGRAYIHFAIDNRAHFELMFRPEHFNREAPELLTAAARAYNELQDRVIAAQTAGYLSHLPPEDVALSAWTMTHGFASLWLDGNLQLHAEGTLDDLIDRILVTNAARMVTVRG